MDIIHIVETAIETVQHLIHKPLKSLHVVKLEEAKRGGDGCLGNIVRFYWDLVVCTYKIDLAEDSGTMAGCGEIFNGDGMRVQGTIIATGTSHLGSFWGPCAVGKTSSSRRG